MGIAAPRASYAVVFLAIDVRNTVWADNVTEPPFNFNRRRDIPTRCVAHRHKVSHNGRQAIVR
jgi:hypothetical protein